MASHVNLEVTCIEAKCTSVSHGNGLGYAPNSGYGTILEAKLEYVGVPTSVAYEPLG